MCDMNVPLTPLESEAMEWLLRGEEPVLVALRQQLASAKILSRELTGYGFYLNFEHPPGAKGLLDAFHTKPNFYLGDVEALVDSREGAIGFLLWVEDGRLDCLEAHTFGEEWPSQITNFAMRYLVEGRDWKALRQQWEIDK